MMTPSSPQPSPWSEHRMLAETIGQAAADAASSAVGNNVDLGIATSGDPEEMVTGRPMPLRAIVVTFHRPLRDVMVFITSLKEEYVRPAIEAVATATITALDVPTSPDQHGPLGQYTIADAVEYETAEDALEQVDALYLEATYSLELPTGELQLVIGTGLLESAACFVHGVADPFAVEAAFLPAGTELELGDSIGIDDDASRYELGSGQIGAVEQAAGLGFSAAVPAAGAGVEEFDAMLAAQERADGEVAAARAAQAAETAMSNVAAAELPSFAEQTATGRWTELLSGVEVELSAELGRTDLALRDITALASESVLTLDQMVNEPVSVYVNGTRYATARLVVVDGEYGIEILEVVEQEFLPVPLAA